MDFFVKRVFDGKKDDLIHLQFQKFSRGVFKNRAMIKAKNSKGKYSVATTPEYGNELVKAVAEKLGSEKVNVTGAIVSTLDLSNKIEFKDKKQFQGVKRYIIDTEMSREDILGICDELKTAFIGLSFKAGDSELKIKPKAPKSGKPSSKGDDEVSPDFCKLKTSDKELVKGLLFDVDDFSEATVDHEFVVEDIEVDYSIKDPKEMREKALRKGKIIRVVNVDGKTTKKEKTFEA